MTKNTDTSDILDQGHSGPWEARLAQIRLRDRKPSSVELSEIREAALAMELMLRSGGPIRMMELLLTERCNLRCSYCWVRPKARGADMPLDTALAAIDFLLAASAGVENLHVTFFGGEPLLRFDMIRVLMPYAVHRAERLGKRVGFGITTNGTLLTEEVAESFAQFGSNILLSIDGPRELHDCNRRYRDGAGSFDDTMRAVSVLKTRSQWIGARLTVGPENVGQMSDSVRFLVDSGVNQVIWGWQDNARWTRSACRELGEQVGQIAALYKRYHVKGAPVRISLFGPDECRNWFSHRDVWGCRGGRSSIAVRPDGSIYPCSKVVSSTEKNLEAARLGSVSDGLALLDRRRSWLNPPSTFIRGCRDCHAADYCTGLCPAVQFKQSGHPWQGRRDMCKCIREIASKLRHLSTTDPLFRESAGQPTGPCTVIHEPTPQMTHRGEDAPCEQSLHRPDGFDLE